MTKVKDYDRVTATLIDGSGDVSGVLLPKGQDYENNNERTVRPEGGPGYFVNPDSIRAEELAKLAFVGPEPEPAEAPAVTTPFQAGRYGGRNRILQDSQGRELANFTGEDTTTEQDAELAELVVELLNKHFGVE